MSIQSEINRIVNFRDLSFSAVRNKGVTVPSNAIIDDLPDYIAQIQTSSGTDGDNLSYGLVTSNYVNVGTVGNMII